MLGKIRSESPVDVPLETVDLGPLLDAVLEDLADRLEDRKLTVAVGTPPPPVHSEPRQLGILLSNLVANAVFYSHE